MLTSPAGNQLTPRTHSCLETFAAFIYLGHSYLAQTIRSSMSWPSDSLTRGNWRDCGGAEKYFAASSTRDLVLLGCACKVLASPSCSKHCVRASDAVNRKMYTWEVWRTLVLTWVTIFFFNRSPCGSKTKPGKLKLSCSIACRKLSYLGYGPVSRTARRQQ